MILKIALNVIKKLEVQNLLYIIKDLMVVYLQVTNLVVSCVTNALQNYVQRNRY